MTASTVAHGSGALPSATGGAPWVDLRSDTVTRPTSAMRRVIASAPGGDDVCGDDPAVNALQARIADLMGKEAALPMPSAKAGNLCALQAYGGRGDEYTVGPALARRLHHGLAALPGITVTPPQTNIVFAQVVGQRAPALLARLHAHGALASGLIGLRFVTPQDVDADGIDSATAAARSFLRPSALQPVSQSASQSALKPLSP